MNNSGAGKINTSNNIEEVKTLLENNDIENAKIFLKDFIETNTDNTQAYFILAQIYETEENYEDATKCFEKVFPNELPLEFKDRILYVYEMADKYEKMYEILKKDYDRNKNDNDICEKLANVCFILKKTNEAIELYNSILINNPENIIALKQLIEIYENTNPLMFYLTKAKIAEIENSYDNAEKEYKKAFSIAEKEEDILQIRYSLAKLYKKTNKTEQALDEYTYIISATEENFSIFLEIAEIYTELNNTSAAINTLKRALHIYENNTQTLSMLTEILIEEEQFENAEKYCLKLVENNPQNIEYKVTLAKIYLQLDKLDETLNTIKEAEKIDQNSTEVITAFAGYYTYTSDFDKAKTYCEKLIQKLPQSPLGYKKMAQLYSQMENHHLEHFYYGIFHELKNEIDEAINEYTIALQYKKDDFEIIKRLANLHYQNNELEIAVDYYHVLFEAKINILDTTKIISEIYIKLHEYQIAQKYVEESMNSINDIELKFLNAKCLYKMKNYEEALELLEEYKEKTKSLKNIDETNKMIKMIQGKNEISSNPLTALLNFFKL